MNKEKFRLDMQGAIFDLDGTLFDSMWVWNQVDLDFLGKRGFEVPDDYTKAIAHMDAHRTARYTIDRFGLSEDIDDIVNEWFEMAKEVNKGKSHPDVYLEAARRLGTNPCDTVVYEDILAGILGAKKGGFKTAAVYEERSKEDEKEILKECDYYIDSFINFL